MLRECLLTREIKMPKIIKNCKICGKQITVKNNWYCLCENPECKRTSLKQQQVDYYERIKSDPELYADYLSERRMKRRSLDNGKTICKICGKPVFRNIDSRDHISGKRMHPQCVVMGAAELIKAGQAIDYKWKSRLYAYGYDVTTVKEMMRTGEFY